MTNYLPKLGGTTKRKVVKHLLARLILVVAFVASTFHAPVIAHEEPGSHHREHGASAAHGAMADDNGDKAPSHEGAGDSLHHHHCPTALDARTTDIALVATSAKALLSFHRANPLTSFSQAPPTEPPSA